MVIDGSIERIGVEPHLAAREHIALPRLDA
jgi:hypothetical protein